VCTTGILCPGKLVRGGSRVLPIHYSPLINLSIFFTISSELEYSMKFLVRSFTELETCEPDL